MPYTCLRVLAAFREAAKTEPASEWLGITGHLTGREGVLEFQKRSRAHPNALMDNQQPSIGRIVVYNHPGSAEGKVPPKQWPAMIQEVNEDGTVEMVVFSVCGASSLVTASRRATARASGTGQCV